MLGVLSSQRSIQGVLYSQRSTLGVLFPHIPMNMSGQLSKTLQQGGKADQEHASRLKLVQVSSIHLLHRGPDLRKQLNKKRRASQVTPHCRCERIITSVLERVSKKKSKRAGSTSN